MATLDLAKNNSSWKNFHYYLYDNIIQGFPPGDRISKRLFEK